MTSGSLVIVGTGIQLGRHISQRAISEIQRAETVFCMADAFTYRWAQCLNSDVRPLHIYYGDNKDRRQTYREMETAILDQVYAGKDVCAIFYGHPGVFADVPHEVTRKLREAGYQARMEPGISAEDCLIADLGLDPGRHGCQSFEATQFLVYDRQIDPTALLILWQIGLTGDLSCRRFDTTPDKLRVMVNKLNRWYPLEQKIIIYQAPVLAIHHYQADIITLDALPETQLQEVSTLVIPPTNGLCPDLQALQMLGYSEADLHS
ncbi:SAM-dependent methyltransferase [Thiolapillus brandeum]|uniref:Uroporphyrin-III C/tetrapyrrole methyltransferase n=1 Tax=Thiolapillus brandeum TaxID=1076588 RepID=A0A7U6GI95_9GAMM|nr:SAM-dependent methyltransferase [Thiolapillus brandeum]BAO44114.1 uroporphyrin-III C/tetrapyrrole methyltransferase [Thiolapillus brandeum]